MTEYAVCYVYDFELPALQRGVVPLGDAYGIVKDMLERLGPRRPNNPVDAKCHPSRAERNKARIRRRKRTQGESGDDSR